MTADIVQMKDWLSQEKKKGFKSAEVERGFPIFEGSAIITADRVMDANGNVLSSLYYFPKGEEVKSLDLIDWIRGKDSKERYNNEVFSKVAFASVPFAIDPDFLVGKEVRGYIDNNYNDLGVEAYILEVLKSQNRGPIGDTGTVFTGRFRYAYLLEGLIR